MDFEEMLRQHQASLKDKKRFTALVKDLFLDQAKNVNLLLTAYNTSPQKLCGLAFSIPVQFRYRCIKYASDSQGESYTG